MKQLSKDPKPEHGKGSPQQQVQEKKGLQKNLQDARISLPSWLTALLLVCLSLALIRVPKGVVDERHDEGSIMAYEFFANQKSQFGTEVFQNVGPYGHLQFPQFYSGILPLQKLGFGIAFGVLVAALIVYSFRYFEDWKLRVGWFFCLLFAPVVSSPNPWLDPIEFISYTFVLLAGHFLLTRDQYKPHVLCDIFVLWCMALLSLMKSTNLPLVALLLSLCGAKNLVQRREKIFARDLLVFGMAFVTLWLSAGQRLANISAYVRGVFAFSSGYNEAMAMNVENEVSLVLLALGVVLLFFAINSLRIWSSRNLIFRIPLLIFECACLFIIWKHSFVRADHGTFFRHFIVTAIPVMFLAHSRMDGLSLSANFSAEKWYVKKTAEILAFVAFALTLWSVAIAKEIADSPFVRMRENLNALVDWKSTRLGWERELAAVVNRTDLPAVKREVWKETIDQFGFEPGWILLNKLNYHPRPMSISFAAYNDFLIRHNAQFYKDTSTAPVFLLARLGSADNRFVAQDDSMAVVEILRRYQPVLVEKGQVLLKRKLEQPPDYELKILETRCAKLGEDVDIPSAVEHTLWCKVSVQRSLWGRIMAFLYKPAPLNIHLDSDKGDMGTAKFLTCSGPTGFQINPLIYHTGALLNTYVPEARKQAPQVSKIRFNCATEALNQFKSDVVISFWTMEPKASNEAQLSGHR
jgi:hypothetical protein